MRLVGMRLADALEALPPELTVSIGARSGYVYIGPAEGALAELEAWYGKKSRRIDYNSLYVYGYGGKRKFLDAGDPADRRVLEVWGRLAEPGIAIRMEGDDGGSYWTRQEYVTKITDGGDEEEYREMTMPEKIQFAADWEKARREMHGGKEDLRAV